MDTTIRVDDAVTTLVNVFTAEPDKQSKLLVPPFVTCLNTRRT